MIVLAGVGAWLLLLSLLGLVVRGGRGAAAADWLASRIGGGAW